MKDLSLKDSALYYAENGFAVAPLWPGSKVPMSGFESTVPSSDPEIVNYWWTKCPDANIAIPTGTNYNSLIVIDADISERIDGRAELEKILRQNDITLPDTSVAVSGSGGCHIYFKNPCEKIIRSFENCGMGIDILAQGSHIVAPPSIHVCGRAYRWAKGDIFSAADADESVFKLVEILRSI